MADRWYYGRDGEIFGPFSGWDVAALADNGDVRTTDTVWEDGDEDGVQAGSIAHLFPAAAVAVAPVVEAVPIPPPPPPRRARATAGPGAVIVGQDGTTVRFRMFCTACKQEDRNTNTRAIVRGSIRAAFFCPKCRKRRTAEIHGQLG